MPIVEPMSGRQRGPDAAQRRAMREFGSLVKLHREQAGMTQEVLGRQLGLSQAAVSEWERGVSAPDWWLWARIAHAVGSDVGAMFAPLIGDVDPEAVREAAESVDAQAARIVALAQQIMRAG